MRKIPADLDPRVDLERLPKHIAVIMDGNGRWAKLHGKKTTEGHEAGAEGVREILKGCRELGIPCLSLYAFSTENWARPQDEVESLFRLMSTYIRNEIDEIKKHGIRVLFMGEWKELPPNAIQDLEYCLHRTENNTDMTVIVGLNYGGRQEILRATRSLAEKVQAGMLSPQQIDEEIFVKHLYVPEFSEVDLLIRTSGEQRVSNFMLWQISYAEMVFLPVLWPDFRRQHLWEAIVQYQQRERRFGSRLECL
ncbi:MAG TPA: polyprenyl diphosphate synthase [Candidatus Hydrogenedens sp.]|nr:di-trans,poly-cis-decaprenylcistransferase [Candidatus Hydrogenedens sp.]HOK09828.1 polyprenyl diphosphate synthase [Candidatus Hydrogenedens sp.]HOL19485.1 polyprenyl diphosphate synthase [Candidatus Hydrogenedens sp.]HPP59411.1 polyprenyl diphosphate synthase [Candidatus Hydrogenedens sp.]